MTEEGKGVKTLKATLVSSYFSATTLNSHRDKVTASAKAMKTSVQYI